MSTAESVGATRSISASTCRNGWLSPTNELPEVGRRQAAFEQRGALAQRLPLQRALDADLELVERARLRHVVEGAHADRLDGGVDRAVPGQHDHVGRGLALADGLQHVRPLMPGSRRSSSTTSGSRSRQLRERLFARRRERRPRSPARSSSPPSARRNGVVVVDEQEQRRGLHAGWRAAMRAGGGNDDLERRPGARFALDRDVAAPARGRSSSDRNRPSPVPPCRRLKNGSKIRVRCSGAIPQPSIGDANAHRIAARRRRASTVRPGRAGLDGVQQQVDQDVLQLGLVGADVQRRRTRAAARSAPSGRAPWARSAAPRPTASPADRRCPRRRSGRATCAGSAA